MEKPFPLLHSLFFNCDFLFFNGDSLNWDLPLKTMTQVLSNLKKVKCQLYTWRQLIRSEKAQYKKFHYQSTIPCHKNLVRKKCHSNKWPTTVQWNSIALDNHDSPKFNHHKHNHKQHTHKHKHMNTHGVTIPCTSSKQPKSMHPEPQRRDNNSPVCMTMME